MYREAVRKAGHMASPCMSRRHSPSWTSQLYLSPFPCDHVQVVFWAQAQRLPCPVLAFLLPLSRFVPRRPRGPVGRKLPIPCDSNIGRWEEHSPSQLVGWMHGTARSGEVLRTTSRQLMNQVASLPLHVAFKHMFILLQLNSYSLGCVQDC